MTYKWEHRFNEASGEHELQKLVNMSLPEVLSLEEAAERLNELEQQLKDHRENLRKSVNRSADLSEQLKKAEEVIEFYGDERNHTFRRGGETKTPMKEDLGKRAREYLSQGYSPQETGMALNMSLEDVLKAKEQK